MHLSLLPFLYSDEDTAATYRAYFAPGSAGEFSVSPSSGTLPAQNDEGEGELLVVEFLPVAHTKARTAQLIVETATAQWVYDISGDLEPYVKPQGVSRVESGVAKNRVRSSSSRGAGSARISSSGARASSGLVSANRKQTMVISR